MKEITLDMLNLDGYISPDELEEIAINLNNHPRIYAKQLFSNKTGAVKAVKLLISYAWNKATAMQLRLNGNINTAMQYEKICDRIYNLLPDYAKW